MKKNKEHGVDYNITAERATITCYWAEKNSARNGIDIKAYISGSDIMATAGIMFRTVCWMNHKDKKRQTILRRTI